MSLQAEAGSLVATLRAEGVRLVMMSLVDNGGITRVKLVPVERLERVAAAGVGFSDVWAVSGVDDHFAFKHAPAFESPSGDMRLVPDITALRPLVAAPGYAWAPVDQYDQEMELLAVCQRTALRRAVDAARAEGIEVRATYELEFTLLHEDLTPATTGPGYSPRALLGLQDFALECTDALERQGIPVDQLHPEYGPGQFEFSVGATDPLDAADRLVLQRITVRQVAAHHGLVVSFAPVVLPGEIGNGCHLHLSPWRAGRNLFTGGALEGGLTAEGASFVAGLLESLPALTCVVAPSAASYMRLQPGHWSGAFTIWGIENREAPLRLIPGSRPTRSSSANVELKTVDGGANPYLAMLASLAAGMDGIKRSLPLREGVQADPGALTMLERERAGVRRLPASLSEAIAALAPNEPLRAAFGDRLFDAFLAVRKMEAETFADANEVELAARHRFAY